MSPRLAPYTLQGYNVSGGLNFMTNFLIPQAISGRIYVVPSTYVVSALTTSDEEQQDAQGCGIQYRIP